MGQENKILFLNSKVEIHLWQLVVSTMSVVAPPIECELSVSVGTFLNNYDIIRSHNRKLLLIGTYSIVGKQTKWEENNVYLYLNHANSLTNNVT